MHIIARGVGNLATNFGVSVPLPSRLIGQNVLDTPRELQPLVLEVMALPYIEHNNTGRAALRAPRRPAGNSDVAR